MSGSEEATSQLEIVDWEWVALVMRAKSLGFTIDQIRDTLSQLAAEGGAV